MPGERYVETTTKLPDCRCHIMVTKPLKGSLWPMAIMSMRSLSIVVVATKFRANIHSPAE
eukprot:5569086-Pyramimonas_sp.AAC.1